MIVAVLLAKEKTSFVIIRHGKSIELEILLLSVMVVAPTEGRPLCDVGKHMVGYTCSCGIWSVTWYSQPGSRPSIPELRWLLGIALHGQVKPEFSSGRNFGLLQHRVGVSYVRMYVCVYRTHRNTNTIFYKCCEEIRRGRWWRIINVGTIICV